MTLSASRRTFWYNYITLRASALHKSSVRETQFLEAFLKNSLLFPSVCYLISDDSFIQSLLNRFCQVELCSDSVSSIHIKKYCKTQGCVCSKNFETLLGRPRETFASGVITKNIYESLKSLNSWTL